jgi:hypothetical protein
MLDSIFTSTSGESAIALTALLAALGAAFLIGLLISFVYMKTNTQKPASQSFTLTLVLLPAVVALIILLVGNNVARAFSLAGAFSIIRFRSAPGDAEDITFVLFSMAVGLAAGMGFLAYAAVAGMLFCAVMILLELGKYGKTKDVMKLLKITVPENLDFSHAFDDILQKYTLSSKLRKIRTSDLGSLFEVSYTIKIKEDTNEKEFIDELRCRNGNLNITLVMDAPAGAEF